MKRNRYIVHDRSRQQEFDQLCHAAALRQLLVHTVITILLAVISILLATAAVGVGA